MSKDLQDYIKTIYTMDGVVRRVADKDWDNQSPNDEWSAKETLGHVIWGMKRMQSAITGDAPPAEQAEGEVAGEKPAETSSSPTADVSPSCWGCSIGVEVVAL